jgi:hypothetical protein
MGGLLPIAAIGQVAGLSAAAALRDFEVAGIGIATLAGLLAPRFRGGTLGAIVLALHEPITAIAISGTPSPSPSSVST